MRNVIEDYADYKTVTDLSNGKGIQSDGDESESSTQPPEEEIKKVARYGWSVVDKEGEYQLIHKNDMYVDTTYQRPVGMSRAKTIARAWSWISCGTITVALRDGTHWVMDGQHRVVAARMRSDIDVLPCMVYETSETRQEAESYVLKNTGIKKLGAIDLWRGECAKGDDLALAIKDITEKYGIRITHTATAPLSTASVDALKVCAKTNMMQLDTMLNFFTYLCEDRPISRILILAMFYLNRHVTGGVFNDERFLKKALSVGPDMLEKAAKYKAGVYGKGSAGIWAAGMLDEINKNLRYKYIMPASKLEG